MNVDYYEQAVFLLMKWQLYFIYLDLHKGFSTLRL